MIQLVKQDNKELFVTVDTIIKYSQLSEDNIKRIIRKYANKLIKNGLRYPFDLSENLNYSEMKFDEKSATLLMVLLPNNKRTEDFKEELINQFFKMREVLQELRIAEAFNKGREQAILELKAPKVQKGNFMSLRACIKHYKLDIKETKAKTLLIDKKLLKVEEVVKKSKVTKIGENAPKDKVKAKGASILFEGEYLKTLLNDSIKELKNV